MKPIRRQISYEIQSDVAFHVAVISDLGRGPEYVAEQHTVWFES
jgi:hypothetical protein